MGVLQSSGRKLRERIAQGRAAAATAYACRQVLGATWRRARRGKRWVAVRPDGRKTLPWGEYLRLRRAVARWRRGIGSAARREGPRLALSAGLAALGVPVPLAGLASRSLPR